MTQAEKMKYLKAAIMAGIGAAGIGAIVRDKKSKKDREKALDVSSSRNAIVVPVSKSKFLEGLETPEEHRKLYGGDKKLVGYSGQDGQEVKPMSQSDIVAAKKDILKARKFDFFGKKASVKKAQPSVSDAGKPEVVSEEKIDGRVVLRGQDGKFVSKTDPTSVQGVEKEAIEKLHQPFTSPVEFFQDAWSAAKGKPVAFTAGAVGSILLAAKISDAINERRRAKARKRLEEAREQYVGLLEGGEKTAGVDHSDTPGAWLGGAVGASFLVPMALTALVTNKIIENRKAEKKRQNEMSDSYPEDPIILYQTHDGDNLKIAADTALMAIMIKRAMIEDAETEEAEFVKSAQVSNYSDDDIRKAVEFAANRMMDPSNKGKLLNFYRTYDGGTKEQRDSAFKDMMPGIAEVLKDRAKSLVGLDEIPGDLEAKLRDPRARAALARHNGLQDYSVKNFSDDKDWADYKDSKIDDYFANEWKLQKGGILHSIISWLAKNLGFGNMAFNKGFIGSMGNAAAKADKEYKDYIAQRAKAYREKTEAQGTNSAEKDYGPWGGREGATPSFMNFLPKNQAEGIASFIDNGGLRSENAPKRVIPQITEAEKVNLNDPSQLARALGEGKISREDAKRIAGGLTTPTFGQDESSIPDRASLVPPSAEPISSPVPPKILGNAANVDMTKKSPSVAMR